MSLINKMLQDLDARGTPGQDAFASHVKPVALPERRAPALRLAGLCAGAAAVAAALGWFAWHRLHAAPLPAPAAVLAPAVNTSGTVKPGLAMSGTITQLPVTLPGAAAVVPAATSTAAPAVTPTVSPAVVAAAVPAAAAGSAALPAAADTPASVVDAAPATPQPAPARATPAVADAEAARAPHTRLSARAPAPEHLPARAREAAPAAGPEAPAPRPATAQAEPKSIAPMEPDSPEAREARHAAAIELATRQTRLARLARLSAPPASKPAVGRKGAEHARAAAEGRQESAAQRAENEYGRALADLQDGRMSEALAALQGALRIDPGHDAARQTLVGLLVEANRPEDAMRELESGLARDPRQPALAMLLARLQIERGGSGIETLTRSLPYAGNGTAESAEYHAFLAAALQRQGRQREAAEQYQQALRTVPGNGVWWMGLGISLQADKRNAEALDAFQKARASGALNAQLQAFVERRIQQLGR